MRLVLDTHVLVWLMMGDPSLSLGAREAIEDARTSNDVFVPAICFWEIGMLYAKGRLELDRPPWPWAREVIGYPGVTVAELTVEAAIASSNLPGAPHGDPADRIIIANTLALDATLVTHDRAILRYADQGHVPVLAV